MRIETEAEFDKELRRLATKYPSIKEDYVSLLNMLEENLSGGQPLGKDCYILHWFLYHCQKVKPLFVFCHFQDVT